VATMGPQTLTQTGSGVTLTLTQNLITPQTVSLTSAGTIDQTGGLIEAGTLSGNSVGGASLTQGNLVGTFGPFSNTAGGLLSFTDGQSLATSGAVTSAGNLTLTTTGAGSNLTLGGSLSGQMVTLSSSGIINESSGAITAATLTGSSSGTASLAQPGNMVTNLGAFSTGNGDFALTDGQALNLTGPLNAGTGSVALTSTTSTITEQPGSMITAAGLIADAGGAVNLDTVANAVGVLSGKAGTGSFRFLDANPLTIGTVGPVLGSTQSRVMAGQDIVIRTNSTAQGTDAAGALNISSNMSAGGNLLVTSRGSLTVSGTLDLAAGKNIVLDANGPFVQQSGVLTVSADPPALVVDTTDTAGTGAQALLNTLLSSPSNGASDTITTPKVVNALPPSTLGPPSNPISFADLEAGGSIVVLIGNSGAISGTINVGQLGISGNGASAQLVGSIGGNSTSSAAQLAVLAGGINGQYLFNACPIGGAGCTPFSTIAILTNNLDILTGRAEVIESIIAATAQESQTQVDILLSRPREFDRFTGRPQDEDIDASIINVFDEERLCEEMRLKSPEAAREVCR